MLSIKKVSERIVDLNRLLSELKPSNLFTLYLNGLGKSVVSISKGGIQLIFTWPFSISVSLILTLVITGPDASIIIHFSSDT